MIPKSYTNFIAKLIKLTEENEVKWIENTDNEYVCKTNNATISVNYGFNLDEELGYYYFKYYNVKNGKSAGFRVSNLDDGYQTMERLFTVAEASAADIEEELNDFLSDLRK